jgi:hypothetical protein
MTMAEAGRWRLLGARQMADDARLEYEPLPRVAEEALA